MKMKRQSKKVVAYLLVMALCLFPVFSAGNVSAAQAGGTDSGEDRVTLKNPVTDVGKGLVVWDCVTFGNYWQSEYIPSEGQPEYGEDDVIHTDTDGTKYLVRKDGKCYKYEPLKWRVLSANEDGSDVFLMADQVIDVALFYKGAEAEITWEKSQIRTWLNETFMETAFSADEQAAVETTDVTTADNRWSQQPGGNDTKDKIYLASIEEMLNPVYGFSSDPAEGDTRKITVSDYVDNGGTPTQPPAGYISYWLRSPGASQGKPAQVGHWGEGEILTEPSVMLERAESYLGVRPVMHVDLSDKNMYSYAGQVTPGGVFVPEESPSPEQTKQPDTVVSVVTTQNSGTTIQPSVPKPAVEPEVKNPGKPAIKKLKNKKGKKITVTLSKKVSGASGYQAAYAVKSSMKGQKIKSFTGTSVTIKGLKKKKTYYVRVRAYTKKNGKTVYGSWSGKKKIKVKK